jgi:hypothetical protein
MPHPEWKCETCFYWRNDKLEDRSGWASDFSSVLHDGECRRNPPKSDKWPMTNHDDWCGKWKSIDRRDGREQVQKSVAGHA